MRSLVKLQLRKRSATELAIELSRKAGYHKSRRYKWLIRNWFPHAVFIAVSAEFIVRQ